MNIYSPKIKNSDGKDFNVTGQSLDILIIDYYRCLDTYADTVDVESDDLYDAESIKEMSYALPMQIKVFGVLKSGHSICVNIKDFYPYFYVSLPDTFTIFDCNKMLDSLNVYYKYKDCIVKTEILKRKPFFEFTGDDLFSYLKIYFKNKEAYDCYARSIFKNAPFHKLYESNIDPTLKFIHETELNAGGIMNIFKDYTIIDENNKTSLCNFEIYVSYCNVKKSLLEELFPINIMTFDLEADSSHGDFPVGVKDYKKLTKDLMTLYERTIKTLKTDHEVIIENCLLRIFKDYYNNDQIHYYDGTFKESTKKLSAKIYEQCFESLQQLKEFYKDNHSDLDSIKDNIISIIYAILKENTTGNTTENTTGNTTGNTKGNEILSRDISYQIIKLKRILNEEFKNNPIECIDQMFDLCKNKHMNGYDISKIYTKNNAKPNLKNLKAIVKPVLQSLRDYIVFTKNKKFIPSSASKDAKISIDYFINLLTSIFDKYLPPVDGDKCIQIGSSFQIMGHKDPYLKHIICLEETTDITNDEMICFENGDVNFPPDVLAKELLYYESNILCQKDIQEFPEDTLKAKESEINKIYDLLKTNKHTDATLLIKEMQEKAISSRKHKQFKTDNSIVIVESYKTEIEVLLAWTRLVQKNDPDIVIGYNTFGFDYKFLYERAQELSCLDEFSKLSRLKTHKSLLTEYKASSAAMGDNKSHYIPMYGRLNIDLLMFMRKVYNLVSYTLDFVSNLYLYKEKVDISPQEIFVLQKKSKEERKRIAIYCLIDGILCLRLLEKFDVITNAMSMANVCRVPINFVFLRGQGVKLGSLLSYECNLRGYLMPVLPKMEKTSKYEGAIVLTPKTGIYEDDIIVTLDFNSLYPSSIISENLSHDSYCPVNSKYYNLKGTKYSDIKFNIYEDRKKINSKGKETKKIEKVKVGEKTCRFKQPSEDGEKAIIPTILSKLLKARKDTRNLMKTTKDPFKIKNLDGMQLAFKTVANSMYGQTGASTGMFPNFDIAASTTAIGRNMIIFSRNYVEKEYKDKIVTLNGEETHDGKGKPTKYTGSQFHVKNSVCVYGDTDSVFIKFGLYDLKGNKILGDDLIYLSMALGKKVAVEISSQLKNPQNLDFEKCIKRFILISKKRYCGHYYTKMCNSYHYLNSMGIVMKRRDNAPIVKHIFGGAINYIMKEETNGIVKAYNFVMDECRKLLYGGFDIDQFVISKTLRSYYKFPDRVSHNVLARRQAQRDPGNKFNSNDRVPYCFIKVPKPPKGVKILQGNRIETPKFIKENGIDIDYEEYLRRQIWIPVAQIFKLDSRYKNIDNNFESLIRNVDSEKNGAIDFSNTIKKTSITYIKCTEIKDYLKEENKELIKYLKENDGIENLDDSDPDDSDPDDSDLDDLDGEPNEPDKNNGDDEDNEGIEFVTDIENDIFIPKL